MSTKPKCLIHCYVGVLRETINLGMGCTAKEEQLLNQKKFQAKEYTTNEILCNNTCSV